MTRETQRIEECTHCGKVFDDGEQYWKDAHNRCYCYDERCGWNDEEN
jgi:predicted  nucleic acid-binding Zn-ribbon protein